MTAAGEFKQNIQGTEAWPMKDNLNSKIKGAESSKGLADEEDFKTGEKQHRLRICSESLHRTAVEKLSTADNYHLPSAAGQVTVPRPTADHYKLRQHIYTRGNRSLLYIRQAQNSRQTCTSVYPEILQDVL